MAVFEGHAKSLSQLYVFYKRLNTDGYYPKLGEYVSNACSRILGQTQKYKADSSAVRAQAQAELAKEKALLVQKFGVNINFDYYQSGKDFKEIIDALNATLNLKKIYERNLQLIKTTKGMKGVYTWYPTYFMHAWEEYWPKIESDFESRFKRGGEAGVILSEVLDIYIPDICVLGIEKMFDGPKVEASGVDPQLKDAYKALISQIGTVQQAGSVANQIYNAYQLGELKTSLMESLQVTNGRIYASEIKPKVSQIVSKDIHSRGGLSMEAMENAVFSLVAEGLSGIPGITVSEAIHSGKTKMKADNILTININSDIVAKALEQAGANRDKNIKALSELGTKIGELDDGFIVYSSDKNYTLNEDFSGYDAGSLGTSAESFLSNIYKNSSSMNTLIGAIQQLGEGAMMQGQRAEFEELLAQDMAYMLFDDYSTIGQVSTGGQAIHIMNLNGIMMPMSVILTLLADAIDSLETFGSDSVRRIVSVHINAPAILYPYQEDQNAAHPDDSMAAWNEQRQHALKNTKISASFLKSFKDIISLYL